MTFSETGTQGDNQNVWLFGNLLFDLPFLFTPKGRTREQAKRGKKCCLTHSTCDALTAQDVSVSGIKEMQPVNVHR